MQVDVVAWHAETERLGPQLTRIHVPAAATDQAGLTQEYLSRWQSTKQLQQQLAELLGQVSSSLPTVQQQVAGDMERLTQTEDRLNRQFASSLSELFVPVPAVLPAVCRSPVLDELGVIWLVCCSSAAGDHIILSSTGALRTRSAIALFEAMTGGDHKKAGFFNLTTLALHAILSHPVHQHVNLLCLQASTQTSGSS